MKTKKKAYGLLFAGALAVATTGAGLLAVNTTTEASAANAATTSEADTRFEMAGAAIRLDDPTGLRFEAQVGVDLATDEDVEFGMIIFPKNIMDMYGISTEYSATTNYHTEIATKAAEYVAVYPLMDMSVEPQAVYAETDTERTTPLYYTLWGSIAQIQYENLARDWWGVAYAKEGDTYTYAEFSNAVNVRNVVYVASAAASDTTYSYTEDEMDIFNSFVSKAMYQKGSDPKTEEEANALVANKEWVTFTAALSEEEVTLVKGESAQLTVSANGLTLGAEWSSNNASVATVDKYGVVTAVGFGEATITANCMGQTLTCTVQVNKLDVSMSFDLEQEEDAYVAEVALKTVGQEHSNTLDVGFSASDSEGPISIDDVTITFFDGEATVGTETSEIIDFENGVITAKKFGTTSIVGEYYGNSFQINVSTYRPSIEKAVSENGKDYVTIETVGSNAATSSTFNVTLTDLENETVEGVVVDETAVLESSNKVGETYTLTLKTALLPKTAAKLGKQTITIQTDKAEYKVSAFIVTMIINDEAELNKLGAVATTEQPAVFDGYFVLGNNIECTGTFNVFYNYTLIRTNLGINWIDAENYGFCGIFDGQGYNVNGLTIPNNNNSLFGCIRKDGIVRNVSFTHAKVGAGSSLIAAVGGGTAQNIYIQCDEQQSGANWGDEKTGFFFTQTPAATARVQHVIIDTAAPATTQYAAAIGSILAGNTDMYDGVYAIAQIPFMRNYVSGKFYEDTSNAGYQGFKSYTEFAAAGLDFSAWDTQGADSFWAIRADGVPYPRNLKNTDYLPDVKITDFNPVTSNTYKVDVEGTYEVITVSEEATVDGQGNITFEGEIPTEFTVTVKSMVTGTEKTLTVSTKVLVADDTQRNNSDTIDVDLWAATHSDDPDYNKHQSFYVNLNSVDVGSLSSVRLGNRELSSADYTLTADKITIAVSQYTGANVLYGEQVLSFSNRTIDSEDSLTNVMTISANIVFADKIITKAEQLKANDLDPSDLTGGIRNNFAQYFRPIEGWPHILDGYIILGGDFDVSSVGHIGLYGGGWHSTADLGTGYTSNASYMNQFSGVFDGRNHSIINMTVSTNGGGLFTGLYEATVKNVSFINANIAYSNAGLLGAEAQGSTIENVNVYGQNNMTNVNRYASPSFLVSCKASGPANTFRNIFVVYETHDAMFNTTGDYKDIGIIADLNGRTDATIENCVVINLVDSNDPIAYAEAAFLPSFGANANYKAQATFDPATGLPTNGWGTGGSNSVWQFHGWAQYAAWYNRVGAETAKSYFGTNVEFVEVDGVAYPVAAGAVIKSEGSVSVDSSLTGVAFSDGKTDTDTVSATTYEFTTSGYYKLYSVSNNVTLDYNKVTVSDAEQFTITVKVLFGDDLTRTVTVTEN